MMCQNTTLFVKQLLLKNCLKITEFQRKNKLLSLRTDKLKLVMVIGLSPIRSVIIRVITKSDDRAAGVRFVYHEYDYRLNWTTRSPIINKS